MVDLDPGALLYAAVLMSFVLVGIAYVRTLEMKDKERAFVVAGLSVGFFLFLVQGLPLHIIAFLEVALITFNGLLSGKTAKHRNIYVSLCLLYVICIHWIGLVDIAQAMVIGILCGVTYIKEYKNQIVNRRVEIQRDIVHIAIGVIIMLMFYIEPQQISITALIVLVLLGIFMITVTEMFEGQRLSGHIYRLERNGASLGHGALWLALGVLFAVSFLSTQNALVAFSAILIGDPVATIVGISVPSPKLPWNRHKSVSGLFGYFAATALISFFIIGPWAILVGAVAAITESLKLKLDDNFVVVPVLVLLLNVIGV